MKRLRVAVTIMIAAAVPFGCGSSPEGPSETSVLPESENEQPGEPSNTDSEDNRQHSDDSGMPQPALEQRTLTVRLAGSGSGRIESASFNACDSGCMTFVDRGEQVILEAIPASDSAFGQWNGCDQTDGETCIVSVFSDTTVEVEFNQLFEVSVALAGRGTGTVTGDGISCGSDCSQSIVEGESLSLTATPAPGSYFEEWSGCSSISDDRCIVEPGSAQSVTATFGEYQPLNVTLDSDLGRVEGTGINCGADCTEEYFENEIVVLTATPIGNAILQGWSGCDSTDANACWVTMSEAKNVSANFVRTFEVSVSLTLISATGSVSASGINCPRNCASRYPEGSTVRFTITPGTNSRLADLRGCDSISTTCDVAANQNRTIYVTLVPILVTETFTPSADNTVITSSVDSNTANTAFPNGVLSVGCNWTYSSLTGFSGAVCAQALVRFDLSRLEGKTIRDATLTLSADSTGVGVNRKNFNIRAQATAWDANSITWNTFADDHYYIGSTLTFEPPVYPGQVYEIDLTTYAENWASGNWRNDGISMGITDYTNPYAISYDAFSFQDSAYSGGPTLEVTYEY